MTLILLISKTADRGMVYERAKEEHRNICSEGVGNWAVGAVS